MCRKQSKVPYEAAVTHFNNHPAQWRRPTAWEQKLISRSYAFADDAAVGHVNKRCVCFVKLGRLLSPNRAQEIPEVDLSLQFGYATLSVSSILE